MAYDTKLADRVRRAAGRRAITEKKMFGGVAFPPLRPHFRGGRQDVVSHLLARALRAPAEGGSVERGDALVIFERHFEVHDRIHVHTSSG
jgi:hypothetical protein